MEKDPVNIFIVEKGNVFAGMLGYIFTKDFKYRFMDFKSGEECLNNLHLEPDVIILDQTLPGMSGTETLKKIKRKRPEASIILLLSRGDSRQPSEVLDAGANEVVIKEDGVHKIIEKLEYYLAIRELKPRTAVKKVGRPPVKKTKHAV